MTLTETLKDPFAGLAAIFASLYAVIQLPLAAELWAAVWASAGKLFTLVSLGALTLPPHWPPQSTVDWVVLVVGGIFAARVSLAVWNNFDRELPWI